MKIIALSCSTSRGRNSDTMLDYFILGIKESSEIEIEKIYLEDIPIELYHYENRTGPTPREIEFADLSKKIFSESNGLIIATPTYNFSVPAHLKNFIDRIRFSTLDFTKKTKLGQPVGTLENMGVYFLVSGGTPTWARRILFFMFPTFWLWVIFKYFNAKVLGSFYSGDVQTYDNTKILEKCKRRGRIFAKKINKI